MGAYFASKAKRDSIIYFLLFLIALELVTTLILVPFSSTAILVTLIAVAVCIVAFVAMLRFREKTIRVYSDRHARELDHSAT